jgi:hypothetical protein
MITQYMAVSSASLINIANPDPLAKRFPSGLPLISEFRTSPRTVNIA